MVILFSSNKIIALHFSTNIIIVIHLTILDLTFFPDFKAQIFTIFSHKNSCLFFFSYFKTQSKALIEYCYSKGKYGLIWLKCARENWEIFFYFIQEIVALIFIFIMNGFFKHPCLNLRTFLFWVEWYTFFPSVTYFKGVTNYIVKLEDDFYFARV